MKRRKAIRELFKQAAQVMNMTESFFTKWERVIKRMPMREPHKRDEPTAYRDPGPTMVGSGSNAAAVRAIDAALEQVNAIARIIDPNCFWDDEPPNDHQERKCERARIKARAILAHLLK